MFLVQTINTLKKPTCRYQLYWRHFQSIQSYLKMYYCSDNKEATSYLDINVCDEQYNHNSNDRRRRFCNINKIYHRNEQSKSFNINQHESPISHINNIYTIVNNEFRKKHISYNYTMDNGSYPHKYTCIINVLWPEEMSFSAVASSKKAAAMHAAKKCLTWLNKTGNVKNVVPILYKENEIESLRSELVKINLDSKFDDEIQHILKLYYENIEPIMKVSSITNIEETDSATRRISFVNLSKSEEFRNYKLLHELEKRKDSNKNLPIMEYRSVILNSIENNQITIIKGETGCGKSTQIPQFIMDSYTEKLKSHECNILVVQPRRISAVSLAQRVAVERRECLGSVVGYHIRLNSVLPQMPGSILFCTTGIALRRLQANAALENMSHVIIDEAHERTIEIDILLALLKKLMGNRPTLKLILMSATINTDLLQKYFSCDVIHIPGKMYPVKTHFLEDIELFKWNEATNKLIESQTPLIDITKLVEWIIKHKPPGGILCFVPGWTEIQMLTKMLKNLQNYSLHVIPFHSKLTNQEQQQIFEPIPENVHKIILATDIAENSITISDIKYVIDAARKRHITWDNNTSMYNITTTWTTQANICQRKGRAGRVSPGESYHLISKNIYHQLPLFPEPEIRTSSLNEFIVTSKTFSNEKIQDFVNSMIEQPREKSISSAIKYLTKLNILDENENLTALGKRIMYFALDVRLSKALILSCVFQCLTPMVSLVTLFSTENEINSSSLISKSTKKNMKQTFDDTSDHTAMIQYFEDYMTKKSSNALSKVYNLYIDDLNSCKILGSTEEFEHLDMFAEHQELIRALLFSATNQLLKVTPFGYKHGYFSKTANIITDENNKRVTILPDSVNSKRNTWSSAFLSYFSQVSRERRKLVSDTSLISPLSVLLFSQSEIICDKVNEQNVLISMKDLKNVQLYCDERTAELLLEFRRILWTVINYIIQYQSQETNNVLASVNSYKVKMLRLVLEMISNNESANNINKVVNK